MKRRFVQLITGTCALVVMGMALWIFALYSREGSISFQFGMLPTSKDQFLDGSGRMLQEVSWHFSKGLRTRGETYGLKFGRGYLAMQVTHVDSRCTKMEAREE
jgi:hypothetical protein